MKDVVLTDYYLFKKDDTPASIETTNNKLDCLQRIQEQINSGKARIIVVNEEKDKAQGEHITLVQQQTGGSWMTQQYIGVLWGGYDSNKSNNSDNKDNHPDNLEPIIIKSRFDTGPGHFAPYLFSRAAGLDAKVMQDMYPSLSPEFINDVLLPVLFINQLGMAMKKGLFRKYCAFERNDAKVKGTIDVARHIRDNLPPPAPLNGKISYYYRERAIDNEVNRLIYTAYIELSKRSRLVKSLCGKNECVKRGIRELSQIVTPASRSEIRGLINANRKRISHSIYRDWEELRSLSIFILRHLGIHMGKEGSAEVYGVLIDMNRLWEEYLGCVLSEIAMEPEKVKKQSSHAFLFTDRTYRPCNIAKPDFLWGNNLILDAKNKPIWSHEKGRETFKREDVFQVLSYMYILDVQKGGIIAPDSNSEKAKVSMYQVNKDEKNKLFYRLTFPVPNNAENYSDFVNKMKKNGEEEVKKLIKEILEIKPESLR